MATKRRKTNSDYGNAPTIVSRRRSPRLMKNMASSSLSASANDDDNDVPNEKSKIEIANDTQKQVLEKKSKRHTVKRKKKYIAKSLTKNSNANAIRSDPSIPLIDLGPLVKGMLVKRPSATVRSPYVADVRIIQNGVDDGEETIVQAHSPALDVGGLCSVGAIVYMSKRPPGGKTSHAIELLEAPGPNGSDNGNYDNHVLVGCHPSLGEKLAEEVLKRGLLQESLGFGVAELVKAEGSSKMKRNKSDSDEDIEESERNHYGCQEMKDTTFLYKQRTYGDSRIDFELVDYSTARPADSEESAKPITMSKKKRALIEVKNVVCSDFSAQYAPEKTGPNHCVIVAPETLQNSGEGSKPKDQTVYQRSGIFPWGRVGQSFEGKKVVSERAIKHLRNLSMLHSKHQQDDANHEQGDCQTVVLFVLNRSDCVRMRACHEACPVFANELKAVHDKGTFVLCFRTRWTVDGKAYFDGMIPVTI